MDWKKARSKSSNIFLIGVLAFAGWRAYFHITEMYKPIKEKSNLIVNAEDKHRYISHKSEQEGIQDLIKLAKKEFCEESWAYLPDKNLWVENGIASEESKIEEAYIHMTSKSYAPYDNKLMKENKNIVFYHIHPQETTDSAIQWSKKILNETEESNQKITANRRSSLWEPEGSHT